MPVSSWAYLAAFLAVLAAVVRFQRRRLHRIHAGSIAVVTGGSSGIGAAIALQLARRGCVLCLTARTASRLEEVAAACRAAGARGVFVFPCDLLVPEQRAALAHFVRTKVLLAGSSEGVSSGPRKVSVLVLNAGRGAITPFDSSDATGAICREMMDVNYFANVHLLQLFAPILAQRGDGSAFARTGSDVLVVSSLAGVLATPLRTAYTASKHALQGFCNALRAEWKAKGVRICVCCPGFVQTEFHNKVMSVSGKAPERHGSFMTASECAQQCIAAMERGTTEYVMTWAGWFGYKARPVLTGLVDGLAAKKAMSTIKPE